MLEKTRMVLEFDQATDQRAWFRDPDDETKSEFGFALQAWRDMDSPHVITVTIRPGDMLNGK